VEDTRAKIIAVLRRRHEVTVEELTKELDLAPATVRRHLDILQRDGHITPRPVRRETGRPHYAFSLTERGHDLLPHHYVRVAGRLLGEIVSLRPQETAGRNGSELADIVLGRLAEGIVDACSPRVSGRSLKERVSQAVTALAEEGLVFEVAELPGGFVVEAVDCLCRRLSETGGGFCGRDQFLLSRLLDAEVEPDISKEAGSCAYIVKPRVTGLAMPSL
jgi:predicted ArsR family transcriptional regulator